MSKKLNTCLLALSFHSIKGKNKISYIFIFVFNWMDGIDLSTCNYVIIIGSDTSFVMFFHFVIFYYSRPHLLNFYLKKFFLDLLFYDLLPIYCYMNSMMFGLIDQRNPFLILIPKNIFSRCWSLEIETDIRFTYIGITIRLESFLLGKGKSMEKTARKRSLLNIFLLNTFSLTAKRRKVFFLGFFGSYNRIWSYYLEKLRIH